MSVRTLWATLLPALVVAGALVVAYGVRRPDSGVEVSAPRAAGVRVTKPGRRETLAGDRVPVGDSVRLRLEPGRYVLRPGGKGGDRLRTVQVYVPDGRFVAVTLRERPARP